MAPLSDASSADQQVMAQLAARLMALGKPSSQTPLSQASKPTNSPSSKQTSKVASATPDSASSQSKGQTFVPSLTNENIAPHASTSSHSGSDMSSPQKEQKNVAGPVTGPSLRGTADQLAAAREFLRSSTSSGGRNKSRGVSRAGRQRLLTKEPEASSFVITSPFTSNSATSAPGKFGGTFANARSLPPSTTSEQRFAASQGVSGASQALKTAQSFVKSSANLTQPVAPTPAPTPVASPLSDWASFSQKPTSSTNTEKPVEISPTPKTKDMAAPANSSSSKSTSNMVMSEKVEKTKTPLVQKQLADVVNVLKESSQGKVPPHLRRKSTNTTSPPKDGTNDSNDANKIASPEKKLETPVDSSRKNDSAMTIAKGATPIVKTPERKPEKPFEVIQKNDSSMKIAKGATAIMKMPEKKPETAIEGTQTTARPIKIAKGTTPIAKALLEKAAPEEDASSHASEFKVSKTILEAAPDNTTSSFKLAESPTVIMKPAEDINALKQPGDIENLKTNLQTPKAVPKEIKVNGTGTPGQITTMEPDNIMGIVDSLVQQLAAVTARFEVVEKEHFDVTKQLELTVQAEERRKFLGTDGSKVPFALMVNCANGETHSIQATAALKIYELIRRVRVKANLAPMVTVNPRIIINNEAVGHGVMLGEVGVNKGNEVSVNFKYDGA